jgi:hypothetical protein
MYVFNYVHPLCEDLQDFVDQYGWPDNGLEDANDSFTKCCSHLDEVDCCSYKPESINCFHIYIVSNNKPPVRERVVNLQLSSSPCDEIQ